MFATGVGLGTDVGAGVGVGDGADGVADATPGEAPVAWLIEGDATWFELQPPIDPTIPRNTTIVQRFITFFALACPAWCIRQTGRQTRTVAIA
jgi:hypothetical protein